MRRHVPHVFCLVFLVSCQSEALAQTCSGPPDSPRELAVTLDGPWLALAWAAPAGEPAGGYRIEAGKSPGVSNVARAGTGATHYRVPVANGTYYIRVHAENGCGVSGPSNEVRIDVTGRADEGTVNLHAGPAVPLIWDQLNGGSRIVGEVMNGWGARAATFIQIQARILDSANNELGTGATFLHGVTGWLPGSAASTNTLLFPGAAGCFELLSDVAFAAAATADLNASWLESEVEPPRANIRIDGGVSRERDFAGALRIRGNLLNAGSVTTFFNKAVLFVADIDGDSYGCETASVDGSSLVLPDGSPTETALRPGESGPFETFSNLVFDFSGAIRPWAAWSEDASGRGLLPLGASYVRGQARDLWLSKERARLEGGARNGAIELGVAARGSRMR